MTAEKPLKPADSGPLLGITAWLGSTNETLEHPTPLEQIRASAGQIVSTVRVVFSPKTDIGAQQLGGAVMIIRLYSQLIRQRKRLAAGALVQRGVECEPGIAEPSAPASSGRRTHYTGDGRSRSAAAGQREVFANCADHVCSVLIAFMLFIAFFDTGDWARSAQIITRSRFVSLRNNEIAGCASHPDRRNLFMRYCESPFLYHRRKTREVVVGDPARAASSSAATSPVVVQSMITCDTMDTAASVQQTLDLVAVGCQIVRITAPTVKDAARLMKNISGESCAHRGLCLVS